MPAAVQWTAAEDFYLIENSARLALEQLCADLGKSPYLVKKRIAELQVEPPTKAKVVTPNGKFKAGWRQDLNVKVRSAWEADVLRWLNHQNLRWQYEPRRFYFEGYRRGARSYMPDIYLPSYLGTDHWLEVKGRLPTSDKTKLRRFQKHYPAEFAKLMVIAPYKNSEADAFFRDMHIPVIAYFKELQKEFRDVIPGWETQ